MSGQKTKRWAIFSIIAAAIALAFSYMSASDKNVPAAPEKVKWLGELYVAESTVDISWIEVVQQSQYEIYFKWSKLAMGDDGEVKHDLLIFKGGAEGDRIDLSTIKESKSGATVTLSAIKFDNEQMRVMLNLTKEVLYTADYKPVNGLGLIGKKAAFQERAAKQQEQHKAALAKVIASKNEPAPPNKITNVEMGYNYNIYITNVKNYLQDEKQRLKAINYTTISLQDVLKQLESGALLVQLRPGLCARAKVGFTMLSARELDENRKVVKFNKDEMPFTETLKERLEYCKSMIKNGKYEICDPVKTAFADYSKVLDALPASVKRTQAEIDRVRKEQAPIIESIKRQCVNAME